MLKRGDDIEEAYRRNLSDVGQFDGIEKEVDHHLLNYGYMHTIDDMVFMLEIKLGVRDGI
jgi:guanylate kinase